MYILTTKYGNVGIESTSDGISKLVLNAKSNKIQVNKPIDKNTQQLVSSLKKYFNGTNINFDIRLDLAKYPIFYQKVWNQAKKIPFGKTTTYGEIAKRIGHPKASRAVGRALASNPLAIVIPCHRVVRKDKSLGGFAYGLKWKKRLLELENKATDEHR